MIKPQINLIAAVDLNFGIGNNNKLLCHLPNDLKHFKTITMGHSIVMGKHTFNSIGKALPGRRNIVMSSHDLHYENVEIARSIAEVLALTRNEAEVFIIGGQSLYEQFMPLAHKIFLTQILHKFEADRFFPKIDLDQWQSTKIITCKAFQNNAYDHNFITLERYLK